MRELPHPPHFEPSHVGEVWRVRYEDRAKVAGSSPALSEVLHDFFQAARRARGRASGRPSPDGISLTQFHLLESLATGPQSNKLLAEAAGVSSSTASRMVDRLVPRGLLSRVGDPSDRRSVLISLTPAGRAALAAKLPEHDAVRRRIAAALEPDEQRVAAALLARLAEVIEEL